MVCSLVTPAYGPAATDTDTASDERLGHQTPPLNSERPLTVPDLLHDERVEADLVDALVQAVGLVDVQHLAVQTPQLVVAQLRTQDLVVKLLWRKTNSWCYVQRGAAADDEAADGRRGFLPTARQNCSTCTAPSCFRKFMKRKRRSCCSRISFSSSFSTCTTRGRRLALVLPERFQTHRTQNSQKPSCC